LTGRYQLGLTAEFFNLSNRDTTKKYEMNGIGFDNSCSTVWRTCNPSGAYYPACYQEPTTRIKTISFVCPAQDAILDATKFFRGCEDFCTFHLTYEGNACHN
jgi:hypothetical protein